MDLREYLTKHDSKPRPDGLECIRLSKAIGRSSFFLYLAALGHKKFGPAKALELHEQSIGAEIDPATVATSVEWHRTPEGRWYYRDAESGKDPARPRAAA